MGILDAGLPQHLRGCHLMDRTLCNRLIDRFEQTASIREMPVEATWIEEALLDLEGIPWRLTNDIFPIGTQQAQQGTVDHARHQYVRRRLNAMSKSPSMSR